MVYGDGSVCGAVARHDKRNDGMRMRLSVAGAFLGRSFQLKHRHLGLSSPCRKGMMAPWGTRFSERYSTISYWHLNEDQERRERESLTSLSGKNSIEHKTDAMELFCQGGLVAARD